MVFRSMNYTDLVVIMSEAIVKEVVRSTSNINSVSTLYEATSGKWAWMDEYDKEVVHILQKACKAATPQSTSRNEHGRERGHGRGRGRGAGSIEENIP
jgi:uncharacterized cupin superfamily protein